MMNSHLQIKKSIFQFHFQLNQKQPIYQLNRQYFLINRQQALKFHKEVIFQLKVGYLECDILFQFMYRFFFLKLFLNTHLVGTQTKLQSLFHLGLKFLEVLVFRLVLLAAEHFCSRFHAQLAPNRLEVDIQKELFLKAQLD